MSQPSRNQPSATALPGSSPVERGAAARKKRRTGSEKRKRQPRIIFRVDDAERAELKASAAAAGLSVGSFIRSLTLTQPRTRAVRCNLAPAVAELARFKGELGRVGGNVAQLLRLANRGEIVPVNDLAPVVTETREFIAKLNTALEGKL